VFEKYCVILRLWLILFHNLLQSEHVKIRNVFVLAVGQVDIEVRERFKDAVFFNVLKKWFQSAYDTHERQRPFPFKRSNDYVLDYVLTGTTASVVSLAIRFTVAACRRMTNNWLVRSQDMVQGLWTLSRGSVDDKLRWAFTLYDLDGDGQICRDEMTRVVTAVYELMGKFAEPWLKDGTVVAAHVDLVFQVRPSRRFTNVFRALGDACATRISTCLAAASKLPPCWLSVPDDFFFLCKIMVK